MKPNRSRSTSLRALPLALLLVLSAAGIYLGLNLYAAPVPARKPAAYPAWWFQREVIPAKDATKTSTTYPGDYPPAADYAVLTQGQLKHLATAAFDELQAHLPGGAGPAVTELVKGWYVLDGDAFHLDTQGHRVALASPQTNDFAPVTHGQMKEVAHYFFDRLQAELYYPTDQPYPLDAAGAKPPADHAVANLGQAKNLFKFDLTTDTDGDGIPDWWAKAHGLDVANSIARAPTASGVTHLYAYEHNLDPADPDEHPALASAASYSGPPVIIEKHTEIPDGTPYSSGNTVLIGVGTSPLVKNGDFQKDSVVRWPSADLFEHRMWWVKASYTKTGWYAVGGHEIPGTRDNYGQYEYQQQDNTYLFPPTHTQAGQLNTYCELDAHWERYKDKALSQVIHNNNDPNPITKGYSDTSHPPDHGIAQEIDLERGRYVLIFDYRGRPNVTKNIFNVFAEAKDSSPLVRTELLEDRDANGADANVWKRANICFSVSGGDPTKTKLPIVFKFDIPAADADSYGVYIDNVVLFPVEIQEVHFGGVHCHTVQSDDGLTDYVAPQWVDANGDQDAADAGENNDPVAFTRNTKPTVGAKMKVSGLPSGLSIKVQATGPGSVRIPATAATVAGDTITLALTESTGALEDAVKFYTTRSIPPGTTGSPGTPFTLEWQISFDGGASWCIIGETKHSVYLTRADPVAGTLSRETLFDIGCRNADGKTTDDDIVDAVWSEFSDKIVKRVGSTPTAPFRDEPKGMIYWKPGGHGLGGVADLLANGDATCQNWALFFIEVLKEQGISTAGLSVVNAPDTLDLVAGFPTARAQYRTQFTVPAANNVTYRAMPPSTRPAAPAAGDVSLEWTTNNDVNNGIFFVNTWAFAGKKFISVTTTPANGPITEQTESKAQGHGSSGDKARAWFGNHAIVKYTRATVDTYYDSSYGGTTYADPNRKINWEDASLQAFGAIFDVWQFDGTDWNYVDTFIWYERDNPSGTLETTISP